MIKEVTLKKLIFEEFLKKRGAMLISELCIFIKKMSVFTTLTEIYSRVNKTGNNITLILNFRNF